MIVGATRGRAYWEVPEQILELRGPSIVPDEIGDEPQPDRFAFGALGPHESNGGPRLCQFGVSGSLALGGQLSIDRNACSFSPDGRVSGSTCMYFPPTEVTFKPLGADPTNRGRRAFELVPSNPAAPQTPKDGPFILVLGPTELSEHRLVIKRDGRVRQVLSLRNTDRDNHLYQLRKLDGVPADERQAFRELGRAGNYRAVVEANNGHVVALYWLEGSPTKLAPLLARFPRLTYRQFSKAEPLVD